MNRKVHAAQAVRQVEIARTCSQRVVDCWCTDCKVLDMAFKGGASAPLIERSFKVVKVDVGKFDRNGDIARTYGVDLKKGIPAVVVLSPAGKVLHATRAGELADARNMGDTAICEFFARMAALDR